MIIKSVLRRFNIIVHCKNNTVPYSYDIIKHSKNDIPASIDTKFGYFMWFKNNTYHRDDNYSCSYGYGDYKHITFDKYNYYYRYNGYANIELYRKRYKFINGICLELLELELNK